MIFTAMIFASVLAGAPAGMGSISFAISGNKECQRRFTDGMLALHSFMYDDAHDHFVAATKADPKCAMAYFGDAMSYLHPLWGEEELEKSRAALNAISGEDKLTPKERAFIGTARAAFGEGEFRPRLAAWMRSLEKLHADFPNDDEAALFYALSLIANSERLSKTKYLMQSLAISAEVMKRKPNHPGAAHYLIHAADTPDHAVLGLDAAKVYAKIAPAASHARHMPSHIFANLGMWNEVVLSNEASWAAAEAEIARRKKKDDERDWHSYSWLVIAHLQLGQVAKAEKYINDLRELILKVDGSEMRFGYSLIASAYLEITGKWSEADKVLAPIIRPLALEEGEPMGSLGCALHAPGGGGKTRPPFGLMSAMRAQQLRARAAVFSGDAKTVGDALASSKKAIAAMEAWAKMTPKDMVSRWSAYDSTIAAWSAAKTKKTPAAWEEAIASAKKLSEIHDLGSPAFDAPGLQLLGEIYADAGRSKDALAAFNATLEKYPAHAPAVLGAARAAKSAGL